MSSDEPKPARQFGRDVLSGHRSVASVLIYCGKLAISCAAASKRYVRAPA